MHVDFSTPSIHSRTQYIHTNPNQAEISAGGSRLGLTCSKLWLQPCNRRSPCCTDSPPCKSLRELLQPSCWLTMMFFRSAPSHPASALLLVRVCVTPHKCVLLAINDVVEAVLRVKTVTLGCNLLHLHLIVMLSTNKPGGAVHQHTGVWAR